MVKLICWWLVSLAVIAMTMAIVRLDRAHAQTSTLGNTPRAKGYTYSAGNRRDPFHSMLGVESMVMSHTSTPDAALLKKGNLNLLGIITGLRGSQAILQNSDGRRYIVSSGDVLPLEDVRVVHLTSTTVTVESLSGENGPPSPMHPHSIELTFR